MTTENARQQFKDAVGILADEKGDVKQRLLVAFVSNGDVVQLTHKERALDAPIWILPGHPDGSLTVHLGYGRTRAGRVGTGAAQRKQKAITRMSTSQSENSPH